MKLTTKGRYAVTALLDLAIHGQTQPITVSELANRQGISQAYLERLTLVLKNKGLLISTRGPGGGYQLSRSPELVSIADIIQAVEDPMDATQCKGKSNCKRGTTCLTHHLWSELNQEILNFLTGLTLHQLAKRAPIQAIASQQAENTIYQEVVL
jgi:Rrf2 family transcriptional regulator, iron-sulfur cluster assembly transcription factor